ncbi:MAG: hypothetical protein ABEH64_13455 [Salinirussus sp.]
MSSDAAEAGDRVSDLSGTGYAERLDDLEGATLAFVDWGKPNGDVLYDAFSELFADEFGVEELLWFQKPSPSSPIPSDLHDEILEADPDGVILAIADCGSCNTSVVPDAISFEELGIPTVQIITNEFLDLNTQVSESKGYEHLPLIALDHPTRYLEDDEVRNIAERIMWTVHTSLTCEECLLLDLESDD